MRKRILVPKKQLGKEIDLDKVERVSQPKQKLKGLSVKGNIELEEKKKESKPNKKVDTELVAKVGYQFDKIWKEKYKTRLEMNEWACKLLKLKLNPEQFEIKHLTSEQLQLIGLKIKFEFNYSK